MKNISCASTGRRTWLYFLETILSERESSNSRNSWNLGTGKSQLQTSQIHGRLLPNLDVIDNTKPISAKIRLHERQNFSAGGIIFSPVASPVAGGASKEPFQGPDGPNFGDVFEP
jgi:hypothetical protein